MSSNRRGPVRGLAGALAAVALALAALLPAGAGASAAAGQLREACELVQTVDPGARPASFTTPFATYRYSLRRIDGVPQAGQLSLIRYRLLADGSRRARSVQPATFCTQAAPAVAAEAAAHVVWHLACGEISNVQPLAHPATFATGTDRVYRYHPTQLLAQPLVGERALIVYSLGTDGSRWARSIVPIEGYCM